MRLIYRYWHGNIADQDEGDPRIDFQMQVVVCMIFGLLAGILLASFGRYGGII